MKVFLMHKDRDFDLKQPLLPHQQDLMQDLELNILVNAMALGDNFLSNVIQKAILCPLYSEEDIKYRQDILQDCLLHSTVVRELYQIPIQAIENKFKRWMGIFTHSPSGVLYSAVDLMSMFVELLKQLKQITDTHAHEFKSEGFRRFFTMIQSELTDDYFTIVENHLKELKFRNGVLLSVELGQGNEGVNYTLRLPEQRKRNWIKSTFLNRSAVYSFTISSRDDAGSRALGDIKDRGLNLAANALAQATDHINNFFNVLRVELAFYIGCINLNEQLTQMGCPITFPSPTSPHSLNHAFRGLYDICLALTIKKPVVGNDVNADQKNLVIITGANQGGKSTFLRSIGQAQVMMQAGMYVAAEAFSANICTGIFTHYKRKEDATMKSGKLDEELSRMSQIVDAISPHALVLFNESFAATNEREGSEIARQITSALVDREIKVFFVTHMYEFASIFYQKCNPKHLFLRAERKAGGKRTYKLTVGEPLPTSFGQDVYISVFKSQERSTD